MILCIRNDHEQLRCAVASFRRDQPELAHMSADRIRQHRPLTYQKLPAAMQHQNRLLLFRLYRHETHRWPRDRLANCRSVIGVVLTAFEIGLHIARWHQLHRVAERLKSAAPVMHTWACFNAYEAKRESCTELQYLRAAPTLADHDSAIAIHAVDLEYRLRNIETNRANLAHGRLPSMWFSFTQPPYGTPMPQSGRRPQHHKLTWRSTSLTQFDRDTIGQIGTQHRGHSTISQRLFDLGQTARLRVLAKADHPCGAANDRRTDCRVALAAAY